jgi:monothiol glutaredoxin
MTFEGLVVVADDDCVLGIKEYSDWPTIPQLYVDREFIGGCDILVSMHQNGDLSKLLEEKKVLVPAESSEADAPKTD